MIYIKFIVMISFAVIKIVRAQGQTSQLIGVEKKIRTNILSYIDQNLVIYIKINNNI